MKRNFTHHNAWQPEELKTLEENWNNRVPIRMWADQIPGRNLAAINCKGRQLYGARALAEKSECLTWRVIKQVMKDGMLRSAQELSEITKLNRDHIFRQLLNHSPSEVHIKNYGPRNNGGRGPALWLWGPGEKNAQYKAESKKITEQRRRQKNKGIHVRIIDNRDPEDHPKQRKQQDVPIQRDPAAAWF